MDKQNQEMEMAIDTEDFEQVIRKRSSKIVNIAPPNPTSISVKHVESLKLRTTTKSSSS